MLNLRGSPGPATAMPADHKSFCFYDGAAAPLAGTGLVPGSYVSRTYLVQGGSSFP